MSRTELALAANRLLRLLALVQLLAALSAEATSALLVVLAGRHLGVGPGGFGQLVAAIGVRRPRSVRCWPGWSATRAGRHEWSGRSCCGAWSTRCWPAPAASQRRWGRWSPMGLGPRPEW